MKSNNSWFLLKSKVDTIPLETIPSNSKGRPDPIYHIIFFQLLLGSAKVYLASINHEAEVMGWGSVLGWMSWISSGLGFLQSLFTLRIKRWNVKYESTILETSAVISQSYTVCWPLSVWLQLFEGEVRDEIPSHTWYAWPLSVWWGALWRRSGEWNSSAFISAVASFLASFPSVTTDSKWPTNNNCN